MNIAFKYFNVEFKFSRLIRFFLVVFSVFLVSSCHLFKSTTRVNRTMSADENMVRKVFNGQNDWKYAEMRVTGKVIEDDSKFGFIGTVKMERNEQIMLVLRSTLSFEVARLYANRDSVWIISKMFSIKERDDWKVAGGRLGYPIDFYALQGILMQSLFTSDGDQLSSLIENLVVKEGDESVHLVSNSSIRASNKEVKYLNDFLLNKDDFTIQNTKIRDVNGQWIADVKYQYGKDKIVKKIEMEGIDSERNFSFEINVIKRDLKELLDINFNKF